VRHDSHPLSRALLSWFDRTKRDLPWRRTRDAYRVWLSEIMLQQTRVETVIPYYERFVARFPTVADLAVAPLDEVLALWSGLGYYRRARHLHAAAVRMAAAGGPPCTIEGWRELPGVGAYTAAAVASIAGGVVAPVLDGNVERVMARWLGLAEDVKRAAVRVRLLAAAAGLLEPGRPGDSNQALMEVGAVVCLPRRPRCPLCPLRSACVAAAEGQPEIYPPPRMKRRSERVRLLVAVVENAGRVLLYRRPPDSALLAGTWELPWVELDDLDGAAVSAGMRLARKYGGAGALAARREWRLGPEVARVRHGITYRDFEVSVRSARLDAGTGGTAEIVEIAESSGIVAEPGEGSECGWFDAEERTALPASSLVGKILRAIGAADAAAGSGEEKEEAAEARIFRTPGRRASRSRSRPPG
jgi:A/G-specific adenine glycosylase